MDESLRVTFAIAAAVATGAFFVIRFFVGVYG
ncbi:hypothetical protein M2171_005360 [Bradyrhizobium japonicum USDA 38]|nr:hypothetical protein [Bradyrhizobium japonicum USDA 38]MCS3948741.1 hypothetical protein [Bradyrhizobium japonicum]MCW2218527.1 hypothetical protein [Bradyrhizobium japonicum]MCW2343141.1 hypothetical protein [Bradyrhizobium japonicum]